MPEKQFIDISRPLDATTPVWPGDPEMGVEWVSRRDTGSIVNIAAVKMGVHVGTHADAPYHVSDTGARIGDVPIEAWIGPALVVDATGQTTIDVELVQPLLQRDPSPQRLLFRTGAWEDPARFPTTFTAVAPAAAEIMAGAGVILVGTDAPSIDPFDSESLPAHHLLAAAGIVNLENLALDDVAPGEYELIALPLRLTDADGSPVRAVLRRR